MPELKKLLFTTLPSNDLGLLTRSLPIANALKAHGHHVIFSCPAKAPSRLIQDAGFENETPRHPLYYLKHDNASGQDNPFNRKSPSFWVRVIKSIPIRMPRTTPEIWTVDHAAAMAGLMNQNFIRANCEAYIQLIDELKVDCVVDFWNPFACIAAKVKDVPLITVIQSDCHPCNKGLIWWKERPSTLPTALPSINRVLKEYDLHPISKTEDLNIGDLTLVMGLPETDPIPEGATGIHIGSILWEEPESVLPEWIQELPKDKPMIWVYSGNPRYRRKGTMLDSEIIIKACFNVLSNMDVSVILTTGHHELPEEYLPLPGNFHFAPYLPGITLADSSDLMIHHGGYGSCQTSLYTGTPSLIIPTFSERESNARKLIPMGMAEMVLPKKSGKKRKIVDLNEFKEKVNRVLSDSEYKKNARMMSDKVKAFGGVEKVCHLIEDFLKTSRN